MYMTLNEMAAMCDSAAKNKGWGLTPLPFSEVIANIQAEVSEAWEEYRDGHKPDETYWRGTKPEGIPTELADVLIRVFHAAGHYGIDLDTAFGNKMVYNRTRSKRHGGKRA
tara:strand:- start:2677 stop:3009 length:333 start_codon:yes stop_codon:yes gene_type:complete